MNTRLLIFVGSCIFLAGCGLFDSGVIWRGGPYFLGWIDLPDEVTLSYDLGNNSSTERIRARVFAVGWDGRYLVAKQHPGGDKKITNYFILDSIKDGPHLDPSQAVDGPL